MSDEVKTAVDTVRTAFEAFKETNDQRIKAIEAKGSADPVLEAKLAKIEADLDKAQKVADEAALAAKRSARVVTDEKGNAVDLDAKAREWAGQASLYTARKEDSFDAKAMDEYAVAFKSFMRKNFDRDLLSDAERKALSVGQDSAGGYFVYPDLSGRIVRKVYETSAMRAYANVHGCVGGLLRQ